MIKPKLHKKENERLEALSSFKILDTLPEADYDNITAIAAQICGTPISLVSLVDDKRQWFKSNHGLLARETPKEYAFCGHAINQEGAFVVPDAREDERFYDNPLVTQDPNVVFYTGIPLTTKKGLPLGSLCVIDHKPRELSKNQLDALISLGEQVMRLLELRKKKMQLENAVKKLESKNHQLERFASVAAHDLKSPLHNITGFTDLLKETYQDQLDEDGLTMLHSIASSAQQLKGLVDGLLEHSRSENLARKEKSQVSMAQVKKDLKELFSNYQNDVTIGIKSNVNELKVNYVALKHILLNLVSNSVKYNDKGLCEVQINFEETKTMYRVSVSDNGRGIASDKTQEIFELFTVGDTTDRFGNRGTGIGLATVKKIIETLGGTINLKSTVGKGTTVNFSLRK